MKTEKKYLISLFLKKLQKNYSEFVRLPGKNN